jgi:hypothetical protein
LEIALARFFETQMQSKNMNIWSVPPREKIYEALSAVADGRVIITGPNTAEVVSSSRDKSYQIEWTLDFSAIVSNDNASFWRGYLGYPIMAVLMKTGRLTFSEEAAKHLAGIHWKQLNKQCKNDYRKVVERVLESLQAKGVESGKIVEEVDRIFSAVKELKLEKLAAKKKPPQDGISHVAAKKTQQQDLPI